MSDIVYPVGEILTIQFVWRIPSGDTLRAIFEAEILKIDKLSEKYVVRLNEWTAGRQESPDGDMRPLEDVSRDYWAMVARLIGLLISLSFEASDGRPLWLRFETLTGEHNFFRRLNELPPVLESQLEGLALKEIFSSKDRK